MASIPERARRRELHILGGDWRAVLAVDMGIVSSLFAAADQSLLVNADTAMPAEHSWDVLVGEDSVSLWLADGRLAVVER